MPTFWVRPIVNEAFGYTGPVNALTLTLAPRMLIHHVPLWLCQALQQYAWCQQSKGTCSSLVMRYIRNIILPRWSFWKTLSLVVSISNLQLVNVEYFKLEGIVLELVVRRRSVMVICFQVCLPHCLNGIGVVIGLCDIGAH